MKSYIAGAALLAALVSAQDLTQLLGGLPQCGQTCISNMLGQAQSLGCKPGDVACLCSNMNFRYGVRDCTNEHCGAEADKNAVIETGNMFCASKSIQQKKKNKKNKKSNLFRP
ncbi:MAG: hypothetical protein Q9228_003692 [Teloschistes exilis]